MVKTPTPNTLRKYGLSAKEWRAILKSQNYSCPICGRKFSNDVKTATDHLHLRNYRKLPPEKRKKGVRGICCLYCNRRRLPKGVTLVTAKAVVAYLEKFEQKLSQSTD